SRHRPHRIGKTRMRGMPGGQMSRNEPMAQYVRCDREEDMSSFAFQQVDVFTSEPLRGNPLAVVIGADALSDQQMAAFANWTNLSETTFLVKPKSSAADYRVRIFNREEEVPFAGHPTLGSCHVWLVSGGVAKGREIVQECGIGLIPIRRSPDGLSFAAPKLIRS